MAPAFACARGRVLPTLLAFAMILPVAANAQCTLGGSGTGADPYLLGTYSDLKQLSANNGCALTDTFRLTADIDASASSTENGILGFAPIGDSSAGSFGGVFHGAGHVIKNLYIFDTTDLNVGLFGDVFGTSVIDSLGLVGAHITSSSNTNQTNDVGAIAGANEAGSEILYCSVTGGRVLGLDGAYTGGIIGYSSGVISHCSVADSVSESGGGGNGEPAVGGIAGYTYDEIDNCLGAAVVSGGSSGIGTFVGGIVGQNDFGTTVTECRVTGRVIGDTNSSVGGITGDNASNIILCSAVDTVSGANISLVGGIAGQTEDGSSLSQSYFWGLAKGDSGATVGGIVGINFGNVFNSYAAGTVSGGDSSNVGGLIGQSQNSYQDPVSVSACYAADSVKAISSADLGGAIGFVDLGNTITDLYWNAQTSGQMAGIGSEADSTEVSSVVGLTSAQMMIPTSFAGFSFASDSAWMSAANSYPVLRGLANATGVGFTGIASRRGPVAAGPFLRWVGQSVDLALTAPALVRVVDLQGRSVLPQTQLAAGSHELALPRNGAMMFVQVRSGSSTTTMPLQPLH
jgi:hypothetical protein